MKLIIPLAISLACLATTSCGTMRGLGEDLTKVGGSVKNKWQTGSWGSSAPAYQTPTAPNYQAPRNGATNYGPADYPPPR